MYCVYKKTMVSCKEVPQGSHVVTLRNCTRRTCIHTVVYAMMLLRCIMDVNERIANVVQYRWYGEVIAVV